MYTLRALDAATPLDVPLPWLDPERPACTGCGADGDAGFESRGAAESAARVEPPLPVLEVESEDAEASGTDTPAPLPELCDEDLVVVDELESRAALRRPSAEAASPSESPKLGVTANRQSKTTVWAQDFRLRVRMESCAS